MMKTCVFDANGKLINIGPWDDDNGNNPLPDGSYEKDIEIVEGPNGGLFPSDHVFPESDAQKIARLQSEKSVLDAQVTQLNGDFAGFIDFYFTQNPDQA